MRAETLIGAGGANSDEGQRIHPLSCRGKKKAPGKAAVRLPHGHGAGASDGDLDDGLIDDAADQRAGGAFYKVQLAEQRGAFRHSELASSARR